MSENFSERLLLEAAKLCEPIVWVTVDPLQLRLLFANIGWDLDAIAGLSMEQMESSFQQFAAGYPQLLAYGENPPENLVQLREALGATAQMISGIQQIPELLPVSTRPPEFDSIISDLLDFLCARYLYEHHPVAWNIAVLLSLAQDADDAPLVDEVVDPHTGVRVRHAHPRPRMRFSQIEQLINDPVGTLQAEYLTPGGLQTPADVHYSAQRLFRRLERLFNVLGVDAISGFVPGPDYDMGGPIGDELAADMLSFAIRSRLADSTMLTTGATLALAPHEWGQLGLIVSPFGAVEMSHEFPSWRADLGLAGAVQAFSVGPQGLTLLPQPGVAGVTRVGIGAVFTKIGEGDGPALLIGSRNGTRLEIGDLVISGEADLTIEKQDFGVLFEALSSAFIIARGEGDSFLQQVLPKDPVPVNFDLAVGWSNRRGLYFRGSAGLEVVLPVHLDLFGLRVESVYIALKATAHGLVATAATTARVQLGPVVANVDRMGLDAKFSFPESGGNLGPVNVALDFKPPSGLGLRIDAGPVTGGGFISLDYAKGRYAGVLQLRFSEISIKAIGILDTKLPGEQPGYSFLIIIAAEFPPIQLGMGFTLNGVGGLAGIHRTMVVGALQAGLRNRSVDHILFPEDPVRDAVQIISDLSTIFPPVQGRYVFGPMAMIGYGTPSFVTAELGVLLELPDPVRLVLLGQVHAFLPTKEEAIAELHLDIIGAIEFANKTLEIDGVLHDSRLAVFDLYGDMALRMAWGDDPVFVASIGGLHPAFQPPPAFPALRRLTLALGSGGNPRLSLQSYLALTPNTLQFGALGELYAEAAGFSISGWLGFDVLLIFSPFSLAAELAGNMALRRGSKLLAGVTLNANLTGPTPWHLWGEATLDSIIDVTVAFDVTIGEDRHGIVPDLDPRPQLIGELQKAGNWSATLPPAGRRVVSLVAPPDVGTKGPFLDPLGGAAVRQRIIPFNRAITKFGEAKPIGPKRYTVSAVTVGTSAASIPSYVQEFFAPAQFEEMNDAEKLSRPSFERMDAGFSIASNAVTIGDGIGTPVRFNTIIAYQPDAAQTRYALSEAEQTAALGHSASAHAPLFSTGNEKFAPAPATPPLTELIEGKYWIVDADTLGIEMSAMSSPSTKGSAYQILREYLESKPARRGRLEIVPAHEVNA